MGKKEHIQIDTHILHEWNVLTPCFYGRSIFPCLVVPVALLAFGLVGKLSSVPGTGTSEHGPSSETSTELQGAYVKK